MDAAMTLVEFLRARLDEDEKAANLASERASRGWWVGDDGKTLGYWVHESEAPDKPPVLGPQIVAHVARHDPARVLREVEAKRRIIDLHRPVGKRSTGSGGGTVKDCQICDHFPAQFPCLTLRLLALPYADHPLYREEWAP